MSARFGPGQAGRPCEDLLARTKMVGQPAGGWAGQDPDDSPGGDYEADPLER